MQFTQTMLHESNAALNTHAVQIKGADLSFYVHYWGGETAHYNNHLHKHSFFEVCYIADGEGVYLENETSYPLRGGVLYLSRPHIRHQILSRDGLYIIFVAFELIESDSSEAAVKRFQALMKTDRFYLADARESLPVRLWQALLELGLQRQPFPRDTLETLGCSLISTLESAFSQQESVPEPPEHAVQRASTTIVHRAKLYILDNLSQPLRLKQVADYLHISARHLSRLFADELGITYTDFVRKERVRQAALLLHSSGYSIKRIAEETGFDTVHYFSTVFKSEMGVTPGEFNRKLNHI